MWRPLSQILISGYVLRAAGNEPIHANATRKQGKKLRPSLALRVSVVLARAEYNQESEWTDAQWRMLVAFFLVAVPSPGQAYGDGVEIPP